MGKPDLPLPSDRSFLKTLKISPIAKLKHHSKVVIYGIGALVIVGVIITVLFLPAKKGPTLKIAHKPAHQNAVKKTIPRTARPAPAEPQPAEKAKATEEQPEPSTSAREESIKPAPPQPSEPEISYDELAEKADAILEILNVQGITERQRHRINKRLAKLRQKLNDSLFLEAKAKQKVPERRPAARQRPEPLKPQDWIGKRLTTLKHNSIFIKSIRKHKGKVVVVANNISRAKVTIDGVSGIIVQKGRGVKYPDLFPGIYKLIIKRKGYHTLKKSVNLMELENQGYVIFAKLQKSKTPL